MLISIQHYETIIFGNYVNFDGYLANSLTLHRGVRRKRLREQKVLLRRRLELTGFGEFSVITT